MYGTGGWTFDALLPSALWSGRRAESHNRGGAGEYRRLARHPAAGVSGSPCIAVRILHPRHVDHANGVSAGQPRPVRGRSSRCNQREHLPLHGLPGHSRSRADRGRPNARRARSRFRTGYRTLKGQRFPFGFDRRCALCRQTRQAHRRPRATQRRGAIRRRYPPSRNIALLFRAIVSRARPHQARRYASSKGRSGRTACLDIR
ncbi:hypothetical protein QFZ96_003809 [Paraburkholderia youngii]